MVFLAKLLHSQSNCEVLWLKTWTADFHTMFVIQGADNPSRCFLACGDGQRDAARGEDCDDGITYSLDGWDLVCVCHTQQL